MDEVFTIVEEERSIDIILLSKTFHQKLLWSDRQQEWYIRYNYNIFSKNLNEEKIMSVGAIVHSQLLKCNVGDHLKLYPDHKLEHVC